MAFQDATDEVDEAAARRLGLNRTDLRCLSVLSQRDGLGASELAAAPGPTRGAMTTVLDRLEASGYARRAWDRQDRRPGRVEMTAAGAGTDGARFPAPPRARGPRPRPNSPAAT